MDLKVGDRVQGFYGTIMYQGTVFFVRDDIATIERDDKKTGEGKFIEGYGYGWIVNKISGEWRSDGMYGGELKLINSDEKIISGIKTKVENIKEKFVLALTKEPQKSFRKAGITNGDDMLTDDGAKVFLTWMLNKHAEEFKKEVVDDLLKEEKKD